MPASAGMTTASQQFKIYKYSKNFLKAAVHRGTAAASTIVDQTLVLFL